MRKVYLESYGVELDFPGYYYCDSKFVPNNTDYIVTLSWHIIPPGKNKQVQTTLVNKTYKDDPFEDLYKTKGKDMILKLIKPLKTRVFQIIDEIQLFRIQKCYIAFSKPGNLFGIYDIKSKTINIYIAKDIKKCFKSIAQGETFLKFKIEDENFEDPEKLIFDRHEKFVAVSTQTQIIIFAINKS